VPEGEEEAVDTKPSSSNEEKWIEVKFSLPFEELQVNNSSSLKSISDSGGSSSDGDPLVIITSGRVTATAVVVCSALS
jgi:hypothetical protein